VSKVGEWSKEKEARKRGKRGEKQKQKVRVKKD
jgi:hypothetical protein